MAKKSSMWTPANIVTCARVVFVPVWLLMAEVLGGPGAGGIAVFVAFCLLSLTDKLDGYLARSRNEVTTFGKFLDPIADKLVVIVALCYLLECGSPVSWALLVIVAREFLVSGLRMVAATKGIVIAAGNLGKWKTTTTMVSICGSLLAMALANTPAVAGPLQTLSYALLAVAVVLTIWSGVDYFVKSWGALADDEPEDAGASDASGSDASDAAPTWDDAVALAFEVLEAARKRGIHVGTAESCTGGLVEAALTAVPGSSDVVMGAVGSYACSVKQAILGVSGDTLASVGAVSSECAQQMAEGALGALGCEASVSVTGIAGPGGATPGKPVGLVWFGVSVAGQTRTECVVFPGDRAEVRLRSVMHALSMLKGALEG